MENACNFPDYNEAQQKRLMDVVLKIDSFASAAASRVRCSSFTEAQCRFYAPPHGTVENGRLNEWQKLHQDQLCVDNARHTRDAIFSGDLVSAVSFALDAGHHSQGNYADTGRRVRKTTWRQSTPKPRNEKKDKCWNGIFERATQISKERPGLKAHAVAESIYEENKRRARFPKSPTIYKRLLADQSWKTRA